VAGLLGLVPPDGARSKGQGCTLMAGERHVVVKLTPRRIISNRGT
jgi:hypothetical protein